jgi:hypothetical protein
MFLALCSLFTVPLADAGHYYFSGPLTSFMVEGSSMGTSTTGIPFTVSITDSGSKVAGETTVQASQWGSPIHVHLNDAKFEGGHLRGKLAFKNESGKVLEGLRLDLTGASERYTDGGQEKTKSEQAAIASPILFADLQPGDEADAADVDVSGLSWDGNAKSLDVTFKLSGLTYLNEFKVGGDNFNPGQLSTDSKGRVYIVDHNSGLWRTEADGSQPQMLAKWGDGADYAFVNPTTGDLIGHESNSHRIIVYSPAGEERAKVPASEDFGKWPQWARVDGAGTLYVAEEDHLAVYKNGVKVKDIESFDGTGIGDGSRFDVSPDGAVYFSNENAIYHVPSSLSGAKKILIGPDWHLGRVTKPVSMRVDPAGNLYVLEAAANEWTEWPRISVFDKDGHFVRVLGRGGKAPLEGETVLNGAPGKDMYDIAFGADGRVYVSCDREFGRVLIYSAF